MNEYIYIYIYVYIPLRRAHFAMKKTKITLDIQFFSRICKTIKMLQ